MLKEFEGSVHPKWILHIVHGFVGQHSIQSLLGQYTNVNGEVIRRGNAGS